MNLQDHLIKATAEGIRIFAAVTTDLVNEAGQRHQCYPTALAALGRTMTGTLLLAANLKNNECITVKIAGDGPLGQVVADANPEGFVRGYVENPQVHLPVVNGKIAVGQGIGKGLIRVTRFTGLKDPVMGTTELVSGEIAEDFTQYLYVSEQTPSSIGLGVLVEPDLQVSAAGGFFIQALPNAEEASIAQLEKNLKEIEPVSKMIKDGMSGRQIIEKLAAGLKVNFSTETNLFFKCQCSEEKIRNVLVNLGEKELASMIKDEQAEVCCHFCGEKYHFNKIALGHLLKQAKAKTQAKE